MFFVAEALGLPADSEHHVDMARLQDCVKPYPLLKAALFPDETQAEGMPMLVMRVMRVMMVVMRVVMMVVMVTVVKAMVTVAIMVMVW